MLIFLKLVGFQVSSGFILAFPKISNQEEQIHLSAMNLFRKTYFEAFPARNLALLGAGK